MIRALCTASWTVSGDAKLYSHYAIKCYRSCPISTHCLVINHLGSIPSAAEAGNTVVRSNNTPPGTSGTPADPSTSSVEYNPPEEVTKSLAEGLAGLHKRDDDPDRPPLSPRGKRGP